MKVRLTLFVLLVAFRAFAQLSVGSSGMTVLSGTPLSVYGLTLTPSVSFSLANNTIQRTSTPLVNNPSINRLYQLSAPLPFSGKVGINYLPAELNGYTESTLQIAYAPAANTNLTVTTSSTVNTATHYVQNTVSNKNLYVVTATALSDLTPTLSARPSTVYGSSPFTVVVDVTEGNGVATNGSFQVTLTKDSKLSLSFDASLTSANGQEVQNSAWSFDASKPGYYMLSTSQSIAASKKLSFGLKGTFQPGASSGIVTVSTTIIPVSLVELTQTNNTDADKVDYFQQ